MTADGSGHFRAHAMLGMNIKMPTTLSTVPPQLGIVRWPMLAQSQRRDAEGAWVLSSTLAIHAA
jgi:hypothetical protein